MTIIDLFILSLSLIAAGILLIWISWRAPNDLRDAPVNNPLDYREDGSIHPGDPAYDMMMEVMRSGKPVVANQREDGTWSVKQV